MKHIAVYVRVSSKQQDQRSQDSELQRWVQAQDAEVVWYRDKFTGKTRGIHAYKRGHPCPIKVSGTVFGADLWLKWFLTSLLGMDATDTFIRHGCHSLISLWPGFGRFSRSSPRTTQNGCMAVAVTSPSPTSNVTMGPA